MKTTSIYEKSFECIQNAFEYTAGTIPGRRHVGTGNLLIGKNNQDGYGIHRSSNFVLATVHDGCGSGSHSEVGALVAPRLMANAFEYAIEQLGTGYICESGVGSLLALVTEQLHYSIATLVQVLQGGSPSIAESQSASCAHRAKSSSIDSIISSFFLFTTVGLVLTADHCLIFSCGDGFYAINDHIVQLGPYEGNAPPYLGYGLLQVADQLPPSHLRCEQLLSLAQIDSIAIGTDGMEALLHCSEEPVPGKKYPVGSLKELWQNDKFFGATLDLLTPWLRQVNSEVTRLSVGADPDSARLVRSYGLLEDDCTIVVARRRKSNDGCLD